MAKDTAESAQHVPTSKSSSKLKHAKNTDAELQHDDQPVIADTKSETKDKKKRKKSSDDGESAKKKKRRHDEDEKDSTKKKKKKRVSFGPGTKTKDGSDDESSDTVMGAEEASPEPEPKPKSDEAAEAEAALEEMRKRKRDKKKERKSGASSTPQIHETPILSYLNRYYQDRASWKFQKNRETNIFKHLYSLEHVPVPFNAALLSYMQGLKGDMAKMRLSQGAARVLKDDTDVDADAEYEQAVEQFRSCLSDGGAEVSGDSGDGLSADAKKRLHKRQRAELVFFAVTGKLFTNEEMREQQKAAAKERAKEAAKLKKRKNRTAIVDISSSSESESDSDSSDGEGKKKPATKSKSAPSKPAPSDPSSDETSSSGSDSGDEISSSGSDSSSSDSDSDNEVAAPKSKPSATKPTKAKKEKAAKPAKVEEAAPPKNKKKQKRKLRTVHIEISSSEGDSD